MNRSIPLTSFPSGNALARDYLSGSPKVADWFHHDTTQEGWELRRLQELDARQFPNRSRLRDAVVPRMQNWGSSAQGLDAANALADDNTYVVTTGQQVGLFGGPLYTPLKAMAVILHARRLSEQFPDRRFIPVFGMASVDSDFQEVRTAHFHDRRWELASLELATRETDNRMVAALDTRDESMAVLDNLEELLPDSEHGRWVVGMLRESYSSGNMVDGFASWMLRIFDGTDLVLVDTSDEQYLQSSADLLLEHLRNAAAASARLQERNARIQAAGYSLQVESTPTELQLFWLDDEKRRHKLSVDNGRLSLRDNSSGPGHDDLLAIARDAPQRFVPGALLGPLWQDRMLPNAAWVGGMAEIAYRAQSSALYDYHGLKMAPSFLRSSATLLSNKHVEQLDEFGWELTDLYRPQQELEALAVESHKPAGLDEALAQYTSQLEGADAPLLEIASRIDPNLEQSFATIRGNILNTAGKLEKKITSALKRHNETITRRAASLHSLAYPGNVPQERVICYASMLARYGQSLSGRLLNQLDPLDTSHRVLIMD